MSTVTDEALVLSPAEAGRLLGRSPNTIRRWAKEGHAPDAFASLPTDRVGIPRWWVEDLISPAAPCGGTTPSDGPSRPSPVVHQPTGSGRAPLATQTTAPGSNPGAADNNAR